MKAKENPIVDKTFDFALKIVSFVVKLEKDRKYAIANQLLKSGTSIGANVHEAQSPESKADFVHKLKISEKEVKETDFWLKLCKHSEHLPDPGLLCNDLEEIQRILGAIITTYKARDY